MNHLGPVVLWLTILGTLIMIMVSKFSPHHEKYFVIMFVFFINMVVAFSVMPFVPGFDPRFEVFDMILTTNTLFYLVFEKGSFLLFTCSLPFVLNLPHTLWLLNILAKIEGQPIPDHPVSPYHYF